MEAAASSETLVPFYKTIRHHLLDDYNPAQYNFFLAREN
jgi:hypothetical protein